MKASECQEWKAGFDKDSESTHDDDKEVDSEEEAEDDKEVDFEEEMEEGKGVHSEEETTNPDETSRKLRLSHRRSH